MSDSNNINIIELFFNLDEISNNSQIILSGGFSNINKKQKLSNIIDFSWKNTPLNELKGTNNKVNKILNLINSKKLLSK